MPASQRIIHLLRSIGPEVLVLALVAQGLQKLRFSYDFMVHEVLHQFNSFVHILINLSLKPRLPAIIADSRRPSFSLYKQMTGFPKDSPKPSS